MHVEEAPLEECDLLALHRDGAGVVHGPLRDVHVVRAPAGHVAGAVVLYLEPAHVLAGNPGVWLAVGVHGTPMRAQLRVVHVVARRAEPEVEVEVARIGRLLDSGNIPLLRRAVVDDAHLNALQGADAPADHVLHASAETIVASSVVAALLGADVEDALRAANGLHDCLALLNRKRHRLLHIYVLALEAGLHHHARVPVVLRADHHAVYAGIVEHLAVVHLQLQVVHLALVALFGHVLHVRETDGVAVAHRGEHRKVLVGRESADVHRRSDASASNERYLELVAGRRLAEHARRHNRGRCTSRNHAAKKSSSADLALHVVSSFCVVEIENGRP